MNLSVNSAPGSVQIVDKAGNLARFMRREPASRYLSRVWGIDRAPSTLAKLACIGGGPKYSKAGRIPLYKPEDLDAWLAIWSVRRLWPPDQDGDDIGAPPGWDRNGAWR